MRVVLNKRDLKKIEKDNEEKDNENEGENEESERSPPPAFPPRKPLKKAHVYHGKRTSGTFNKNRKFLKSFNNNFPVEKKLAIKRQHPNDQVSEYSKPNPEPVQSMIKSFQSTYNPSEDRSCFTSAPKQELKPALIRNPDATPLPERISEKDQEENKKKRELLKEAEKKSEKWKIIVKDNVKLIIRKKLEQNDLKKASGSIVSLLDSTLVAFYKKKLEELKNIALLTDEMVKFLCHEYIGID